MTNKYRRDDIIQLNDCHPETLNSKNQMYCNNNYSKKIINGEDIFNTEENRFNYYRENKLKFIYIKKEN